MMETGTPSNSTTNQKPGSVSIPSSGRDGASSFVQMTPATTNIPKKTITPS